MNVSFRLTSETFLPVVSEAYINSTMQVGQIDKPDGKTFRVNCFLPDTKKTSWSTLELAQNEMIKVIVNWIDDAGLVEDV